MALTTGRRKLRYVADADGNLTDVLVPIDVWRELSAGTRFADMRAEPMALDLVTAIECGNGGSPVEEPRPHPRFSSAEIFRLGEEWYQGTIRPLVEAEENIGKQIVIDIETGDYEIDKSGLAASHRLLDKHPGAALYGARIGYDAVYGIGTSPRRIAPK